MLQLGIVPRFEFARGDLAGTIEVAAIERVERKVEFGRFGHGPALSAGDRPPVN
jgi:hypothetical protein